jgi:two-component system response regulator DctR
MIKKLDTTAIIDIAEDGIEGLKKIQNSKYDIVFLDKRMPKMDGYEVLEKVKELNIKTNIYLLTADGDNETINKTKEYNVGYIAKPITLATLKSILGFIPKDENDSNI